MISQGATERARRGFRPGRRLAFFSFLESINRLERREKELQQPLKRTYLEKYNFANLFLQKRKNKIIIGSNMTLTRNMLMQIPALIKVLEYNGITVWFSTR